MDVSGIMQSVNTTIIIAVGGSILITVLVLFFVFRTLRGVGGMGRETAQILATGEPAQATVLTLDATGMMVNYNPVVLVTLQITPRTRPAYQAQVKTLIPAIKMAQVQPGMNVEVRFDPNDPSKVALALR